MRKSAFGLVAIVASLTAFVATIGGAKAQEPERGETVTSRSRGELDPLGVRMGSFMFFPQLSLSGVYDDNIYRADTGEESDIITVISPSMQLRSNWNNHALNFFATGDFGFYSDFDQEDYQDYSVGADGRADFTRDNFLTGALSYSTHHEERESPDDANGVEPTEFSLLATDVAYVHRFGRFTGSVGAGFQRYDFDDVVTSVPSTINNDDRDRDEREMFLRLGYDIVPGYEAFVRGTYVIRDYADQFDDNGFERSSTGYEVVAGAALDFTGVTTGEVFAGYRSQSPDDIAFSDITGVQYGGTIVWNVTGLTTFNFLLDRSIEETTLDGSSGYFATHAGVKVDHELLRNLLLGANVDYTRRQYEEVVRDDTDAGAGLYAKYMLNRHLYVSLDYDYARRSSNAVGEDFTNNVYMLRLQTQY